MILLILKKAVDYKRLNGLQRSSIVNSSYLLTGPPFSQLCWGYTNYSNSNFPTCRF